jgi:hypothetical protein
MTVIHSLKCSSSKPKSYKIEKRGEEEFFFSGDGNIYTSIMQLVAAYRTGEDSIFLQECLPPSEYGMFHCVYILLTLNTV